MSSLSRVPEERSIAEQRWVSFQPYLQSKGYQLRPRYHPDWVPSWKTTGSSPHECEDSIDSLPLRVLDATRTRDQLQVVIKMLIPSEDGEGVQELEILQHFASPPYGDDPANHIVPCLDAFPIPDVGRGMFLIMPLLSRYHNPPFYDLSEIHDFLSQTFEGLAYLHAHEITHCDIAPENILMNKRPLYDQPFHPFYQHRTLDARQSIAPRYVRSQRPVRYYYIDFGYARWFRDPVSSRTVTGIHAKEQAPEQVDGAQYDPFQVDVYQLGAILRRDLIPKYKPLRFLLPLAREMTHSNPQKRPSVQSAQRMMNTHFAGLSGFRKRWPLVPPDAPFRDRIIFFMAGLTTEIVIILKGILKIIFLQY